jgi:dihydroorotate dehydrogenase
VGTAVYADPDCPARIAAGLGEYLSAQGAASVSDIVGTLRIDPEWVIEPRRPE